MRHAVATAILAILILLGWWYSADRRPARQADIPVRHETADGTPDAALEPEGADPKREAKENEPTIEETSLSGTSVDGALSLADGRFVPDRYALRMFDYFLSTEGELSVGEIRALVEEEARARVPADQVAEVMDLFDNYLRYRHEASELAERSSAEAYFDELKELQSEIFGDHAIALFRRENRMVEYAIARKAIADDSELSITEKNARLADLEATLPEPLRELRSTMNRQATVSEVVEQMRRDGLSEEEVFEYRADEFGEEAAERLAELDSQRAEWNGRLEAYEAERDEIRAQGLDPRAEEHALELLRAEHFAGPEIMRVRALDGIDGDARR